MVFKLNELELELIAKSMSTTVKDLELIKEEKKQAMRVFTEQIKELEGKLIKLSIAYSRDYKADEDEQLVLELTMSLPG